MSMSSCGDLSSQESHPFYSIFRSFAINQSSIIILNEDSTLLPHKSFSERAKPSPRVTFWISKMRVYTENRETGVNSFRQKNNQYPVAEKTRENADFRSISVDKM